MNFHSEMKAELTLDAVDSCGREGRPIEVGNSRLMAQVLHPESIWYGFVVTAADEKDLLPGGTWTVKVAFLDDPGARQAIPRRASVLFGDGVCSRGVLIIGDEDGT